MNTTAFAAIDVETANADVASICQVGVAVFRGGQLIEQWKTYIDPDDYFDEINVSIHGIDEKTVRGAPILPDAVSELYRLLDSRVSVSHTHFDRVAVTQSFEKHKLRLPECEWLDSARVARRAWAEFSKKGYGLANVCAFLGYEFKHHDALEDAKAAAFVLNAAIEKTGLGIDDWLRRVEQPIDSSSAEAIIRDGNPDGFMYGEVVVFTGALNIPRRQAADMAASLGCQVDPGVTKRTTVLVVGDQDIQRLAGHEKSAKHRKAEMLMSKGQRIRILRETDFRKLAELQK